MTDLESYNNANIEEGNERRSDEATMMAASTSRLVDDVRSYALAVGFSESSTFDIKIIERRSRTVVLHTTSLPGAKTAPDLSSKQQKLLIALLAGPVKGETLARRVGYENRSTLYSGRGLTELLDRGLVTNTEDGYRLTPAGREIAESL